MYNSDQIRAQGPLRPLTANITQIIIGLMGTWQFFVPSFSFFSSWTEVAISAKAVFGLCSS